MQCRCSGQSLVRLAALSLFITKQHRSCQTSIYLTRTCHERFYCRTLRGKLSWHIFAGSRVEPKNKEFMQGVDCSGGCTTTAIQHLAGETAAQYLRMTPCQLGPKGAKEGSQNRQGRLTHTGAGGGLPGQLHQHCHVASAGETAAQYLRMTPPNWGPKPLGQRG